MMASPFAVMDRLSARQLDCPVLFESLAGPTEIPAKRSMSIAETPAPDELAAVAILSEN
jgi:hypothetical protein